METVDQIAEKYQFEKTPSTNENDLVFYHRYWDEHSVDGPTSISMSVHQTSPDSFDVSLFEFLRTKQSKISKKIQTDLAERLSESIGKEYITSK